MVFTSCTFIIAAITVLPRTGNRAGETTEAAAGGPKPSGNRPDRLKCEEGRKTKVGIQHHDRRNDERRGKKRLSTRLG